MKIRKLGLLFISIVLLTGFAYLPALAASSAEITVSAAMSLKNAFQEIAKGYEVRNRGIKILFNFGASGALMRQIEGGAPVDVFASAAQKDMDDMSGKGLILAGSRANFAANSVVLIVPATSGTRINSFEGLVSGSMKRIAVGNFRTVPAGRYAEEIFNYYKLMPSIGDRLIFAENVRQVMDYVARSEVDAGVLYSTDALMRAKEVRVVATAPPESHKPIVYPIAVVKGTKNEAAAKGFVSYILSSEGKKILAKYGFKVKM